MPIGLNSANTCQSNRLSTLSSDVSLPGIKSIPTVENHFFINPVENNSLACSENLTSSPELCLNNPEFINHKLSVSPPLDDLEKFSVDPLFFYHAELQRNIDLNKANSINMFML